MNQLLLAVYRGALRLYPRTFRRQFHDALVQTVLDQCTFGGRSVVAVVVREVPDVAGSALRMRGEDPMSRFVVSVVVLVAAVVAALAAWPVALAPMALVAIAVFVAMRETAPVDVRSGHPARWLATAVATIGAAIAIPVIDGGELSEPAWTLMAVLVVLGVGLAVAGLAQLVAATRGSQPSTR